MPLWIIPLAMAAMSAVKHYASDKPAWESQKNAAAAQTKWSPWTGFGPGQVGAAPSAMGAVLKGGLTGAALASGLGAAGVGSWGLGAAADAAAPAAEEGAQVASYAPEANAAASNVSGLALKPTQIMSTMAPEMASGVSGVSQAPLMAASMAGQTPMTTAALKSPFLNGAPNMSMLNSFYTSPNAYLNMMRNQYQQAGEY